VRTRIPPRYQKLIAEGVVKERDVRIAIAEAKIAGLPIAKMLRELNFLKEGKLQHGKRGHDKESVDLSDIVVDEEILEMIPQHKAEKYGIMPYTIKDGKLILVANDPENIEAIDWLTENLALPFEILYNKVGDIHDHISKNYLSSKNFRQQILQIDWNSEKLEAGNSVREVVKHLILYGIRNRATDIHINPEEHCVRIKYRIDGTFSDFIALPKSAAARIATVIKLMAAPGVKAEVYKTPQDGSFRLSFGTTEMDVRLSVIPELHGENIVLRINSSNALRMDLADLGMPPHIIEHFRNTIRAPQGLVLVTGRTGSGKTTTLYSALMNLDQIGKNILTLEDPIELPVKNIRQFQVDPEYGITFSDGLRAFLRQDPDIIMVGEMRDKETIELAMRAANTGHLVLSTLHTNSALQSIVRLLDMGVEPFIVASSLKAVLSQRLVRKLCTCKQPKEIEAEHMQLIIGDEKIRHFDDVISAENKITVWEPKGCQKCNGTGYYGRTGLFEFLKVNSAMARFISQPRDAATLEEWTKKNMPWFTTIEDDAINKVKAGLISLSDAMEAE